MASKSLSITSNGAAAKTGEERLQQMDSAVQGLQYVPSENVTAASAQLQNVANGAPAEYKSEHAEQLGSLYDSVINRGSYAYSAPNDALYQQYKQQYQALGQYGRDASVQTVGAMNGGYGNQWAASVGDQLYGEYLKGLNDIVPSLEQNAYGAYQAEGTNLATQLAVAQDRENTDYNRWQQDYANWQADRQYADNRYQQLYANDYTQFSDNVTNAMTVLGWEREDATTVQANAFEWATTLLSQGVMPIDAVLQQAGISQDDALAIAKKYGYSSGGSGSGSRRRKSSGQSGNAGNKSGAAGVDAISSAAVIRRKRRR